MLLAARPDALSRCLAVITRAIETDLIRRAGLTRASGARSGIVTLVQRFGSAANLNVHLHMLVLDGVYEPSDERVRFRRVPAPNTTQLGKLLDTIIARTLRRLTHDGTLIQDSDQPYLDLEARDALDTLSAASVRYRIADGPGAGRRTLTVRNPTLARDPSPKPFTVDRDGFSLNAAVACDAHQRDKLERIARYVTRPAICTERLSIDSQGRVVLELKTPFRDGTTHLVFTPEDWMARLAALVPRPRANLTRYHGVFAPNCKLRKLVVPTPSRHAHKHPKHAQNKNHPHPIGTANNADTMPTAPLSWAERLRRVFLFDITRCPHCGGTLRVIADVTDPALINRILAHVRKRGPPAPRRVPRRPQQPDLLSAS